MKPPIASNSGENVTPKIEDEEDELDDKDALEKEKCVFSILMESISKLALVIKYLFKNRKLEELKKKFEAQEMELKKLKESKETEVASLEKSQAVYNVCLNKRSLNTESSLSFFFVLIVFSNY